MDGYEKAFGRAFALLRDAVGERQRDVAATLGVTTGTVGRLELGDANPQWRTQCRALAAIGATPFDMAIALEAATAGKSELPEGYGVGNAPEGMDRRLLLWLLQEMLALRRIVDELQHDGSLRPAAAPGSAGKERQTTRKREARRPK